jgi:hypothetical protein
VCSVVCVCGVQCGVISFVVCVCGVQCGVCVMQCYVLCYVMVRVNL